MKFQFSNRIQQIARMIQIKRNNANLLAVDNPLSSSNYSKAVMGEEQITLVWEQPTFLQLNIGDYIVYEGSNFTMNQIPTVKKLSTRVYQYNAVFQSTKYELSKAIYMLFDNTDTVPLDEFPLTGTAETFMQLLIDNLNRVAGVATWSLGDVIPGTEYKNLTFSDEDCLTVLGRLADEFATEYHVINHTIHLKKISTDREITLQYGSTLYDIERSSVNSSDIVTRLYVFGSSKNIAANYRGGSTKLLLPAPDTYLQHANAALYGIIEQSKTFEDIYPRLSSGAAGTVTSVGNEFTFTDSHLDFNVNDCLLDGTKAKIRFNTGECAGYDFEIASYNNATKTYVIIANTGEKDFTLPTTDLKPAIGDKYILIDLVMPANYVTSGEFEVKDKGLEYLNANATPKVNYKATFSAVYAKQHVQNIECGDTVPVVDTNIGINERLRIVKITKGLTDFYNVQFDLSNTVTKTALQRIAGDVANVTNQVVVTNDQVNKNRLQAYQNTREVKDMVFDPDGYFDTQKIKPASIETGMLSVGTKSQSFQLACTLQPNYLNNPQVITWSAGTLAHFTLVDDQIKEWVISEGSLTIATQYASSAMYIYARCSRTGTTGDIYFSTTATKFDADGTNWMFLIGLLHTPITGVRGISLSYGETTINGANIKTGVISGSGLEINLVTGIIKGQVQFKSGESFKEVGAGIADAKSEAIATAATDSTTKANTAKDNAISTASADATNKANAAIQTSKEYSDAKVAVINQSLADLQTQYDGAVSNWPSNTQTEAPTLSNFPANQWTSNTERDRHILDVYTNYQEYVSDAVTPNAGKSWKFVKSEAGVYSWSLIADNNQSKAYLMSVKATAIANQKITTFSAIPNTLMADGFCYRKGDLWSLQSPWNGFTVGELLSAAQDSTSFVSSDWTKWVRYTGDEAVNNLVIGGVNLLDDSSSERTSGSEYLFAANLAPVFDIYGLGQYTFSFDLKVAVAGTIQVYCSDRNWDERKYYYVESSFNVTTEYKRYSMIVNVTAANQLADVCSLAFYGQYGTGVSPFVKNIQIELGSKATGYNISLADSKKAVADVKVIADNAQTAANTANSSISSLNNYVDGSFKDGVISTSEAQAIEKYKNQVTKDFNDLIAGYNVIYANTYLVGSAKTDLLNAKVTMSGAKDNLLASINAAIADGKTTVSEKADVDTKYSAWDSSYSTYKSKLELANKAIQANLDSIAQTAASNAQVAATAVANTAQASANTAQSTIDNLNISTKNLVSGDGSELLVYGYMAYNALMKRGKEYCGTIMAKSDRTVNYNMYFLDSVTGSFASAGITLTTTYQQFSIRGICPNWWNEATGILIVYQSNVSIPIWTKEVSVVEGGKPMLAWMASPEYIASKLTALDYLKLAFGGSTEITGGVVAANVLLLKNIQGAITGGLSGLSTDNVCMWQGGTYQQAIDSDNNPSAVAGIDRKDGSGHRAKGKLLWDKFGGLMVGAFKIIAGAITGYEGLFERVRITTAAITPLQSLLDAGWETLPDRYRNYSAPSFVINSESTSSQESAIVTISSSISIPAATSLKLYSGGSISYSLANNNGAVWTGTSERFDIEGLGSYTPTPSGTTISIAAGTYNISYVIEVVFNVSANGSSDVSISNSQDAYVEVQSTTPSRTEIGNNGFMSFWTSLTYFFFDKTGGCKGRGAFDIPAGLGGGSIDSSGTTLSYWGKIDAANKIVKSGSNYTITHNINDSDYSLILTPKSTNVPYYSSKANNTVVVTCAGGFDFILIRTK